MTDLNDAVSRAIARAPSSIRELAVNAQVSNQLLSAIMRGTERATPRVAEMIARALEKWGKVCYAEAARLRNAVERTVQEEGR